jgi:hypothetical protein
MAGTVMTGASTISAPAQQHRTIDLLTTLAR